MMQTKDVLAIANQVNYYKWLQRKQRYKKFQDWLIPLNVYAWLKKKMLLTSVYFNVFSYFFCKRIDLPLMASDLSEAFAL